MRAPACVTGSLHSHVDPSAGTSNAAPAGESRAEEEVASHPEGPVHRGSEAGLTALLGSWIHSRSFYFFSTQGCHCHCHCQFIYFSFVCGFFFQVFKN